MIFIICQSKKKKKLITSYFLSNLSKVSMSLPSMLAASVFVLQTEIVVFNKASLTIKGKDFQIGIPNNFQPVGLLAISNFNAIKSSKEILERKISASSGSLPSFLSFLIILYFLFFLDIVYFLC